MVAGSDVGGCVAPKAYLGSAAPSKQVLHHTRWRSSRNCCSIRCFNQVHVDQSRSGGAGTSSPKMLSVKGWRH